MSTLSIAFSSPVLELPFKAFIREVKEYQESNDFDPIKDVGQNRFHVGRTSYFAPDCAMSDEAEACKGLPVAVYNWLIKHAPQALVEMDEWQSDLEGPWDEDDVPADANLYVNFRDDYRSAVQFKQLFAGQAPDVEDVKEYEAVVGYAGIVMDRLDGGKTVFRCPITCNDTNAAFDNLKEHLEAHIGSNPEYQAYSDEQKRQCVCIAAITNLTHALVEDDTFQIGAAMEVLHAYLGQPQGYVVHLTQISERRSDLKDHKVWQNKTYDEAKAAVDAHINQMGRFVRVGAFATLRKN